jgi:hypothetical protein
MPRFGASFLSLGSWTGGRFANRQITSWSVPAIPVSHYNGADAKAGVLYRLTLVTISSPLGVDRVGERASRKRRAASCWGNVVFYNKI